MWALTLRKWIVISYQPFYPVCGIFPKILFISNAWLCKKYFWVQYQFPLDLTLCKCFKPMCHCSEIPIKRGLLIVCAIVSELVTSVSPEKDGSLATLSSTSYLLEPTALCTKSCLHAVVSRCYFRASLPARKMVIFHWYNSVVCNIWPVTSS